MISNFAFAGDARTAITIYSGSGYTDPADSWEKNCEIDANGKVAVSLQKALQPETKKTYQLNQRRTQKLLRLIEDSKGAEPKGAFNNYSGDMGGFYIEAYPVEGSRLKLASYSEGQETLDSKSARKLIRYSSRMCGMELKRQLFKLFSHF